MDGQHERKPQTELDRLFNDAIRSTPEQRLQLAESEAEDHQRAATAMANALRDIHNEIAEMSEMSEVERHYSAVISLVTIYTD